MRFQTLAGALALAGSSAAFSDSAPWIMLSSSKFPDAPSADQIQTNAQVLNYAKNVLSSCPTKQYLIASQPGLNVADLRGSDGSAMPQLCKTVEDSRHQGKYIVSEVVGAIEKDEIVEYIETACSKQAVNIEYTTLKPLTSDKAGSLAENDFHLGEIIDGIMDDSYTILFIGTPGELTYEAEFDEPVRMDLKRDIHSSVVRRQNNETEFNKLPLFEKYQFFTPGIFMGVITAIVLLSILGVGLKALASLEVSYGAFDKEMGPAAQKKQQ